MVVKQLPITSLKRRLPQFSLKHVFVLITLLCALAAWVTAKARATYKQESAVRHFTQRGGTVGRAYQWPVQILGYTPGEAPWEPRWARRLLGVDFFTIVTEVFMFSDTVTGTDLDALARLEYLKELHLCVTTLPRGSLRRLAATHALEKLVVDCVEVSPGARQSHVISR
jgi:hypothetical protein